MAPHRAHPHSTDRRQGEKHTSAEYVRTADIASTAWGWEHISEPEASHTRHGHTQAEKALRTSERRYTEGSVCCPSYQLICTPARQTDQRADWISLADIPSSESVYTTPREEFNDVCLSTCTGCEPRRVAFKKTSAFQSVLPPGVSHFLDMRRWSLPQQYFRVPSEYKTDQCSSGSCQSPSNGTLRSLEPSVSQGQHSATGQN
jgi:hypothetical protein